MLLNPLFKRVHVIQSALFDILCAQIRVAARIRQRGTHVAL